MHRVGLKNAGERYDLTVAPFPRGRAFLLIFSYQQIE